MVKVAVLKGRKTAFLAYVSFLGLTTAMGKQMKHTPHRLVDLHYLFRSAPALPGDGFYDPAI